MSLFRLPTTGICTRAGARHSWFGTVRGRSAVAFFALQLCSAGAIAGDGNGDDKTNVTEPTGIPSPSIATSLPSEFADPFGSRKTLAERGATFKLNYTGEIFGNVTGGIRRDTKYNGLIELVLDFDLKKMIGWKDAKIHANAFQIQGGGLTKSVGSLDALSGIEALPTIRLYEAWLEQKLLNDLLSIRFGQLAADTEFLTSATALHFVNSTFGFPTIDAIDLPSGGPAYPLATPGVRLQIDPSPGISLLAAVFNGDPAGPGNGEPQERNRFGVNFRVSDPPLWIGEMQYKYNHESAANLPGVLKLGGWYHNGSFDNVRFGTDGLSLATGNGIPAKLHGNWGIYGVIDQQIWQMGNDRDHGAKFFARISGSPSDRNQIDFYIDGGFTFSGLVPRRPDDVLGIAVAYNRISGDVSALNHDQVRAGQRAVVSDYEALLELTYQAQIVPGWIVQPDVQYIWHPGGHAPTSDAPDAPPIANATVLGIRTVVNY